MENAQDIKILVKVATQTVEVRDPQGVVFLRLPVSTSKFGLGFEEGSLRTPTGLFRVSEKIGDGLPPGAVLKARVWTQEIWSPASAAQFAPDADLILTRILWLDGLEPQNANTKGRYIYFHGTNHEDKIGAPDSHGCIRLRNDDMLTLFRWVNEGDKALILA
ncbi:L,D-transpeptidase [Oscillatoria amoena NRMC-F 0135]|nr:L,D-transpeptidase [Oscillatoria laete-virens]MDL5046028.1 L,D-transpeptidase [Oscillatoria amoena NRMC-F 0135]MDL5052736.1 L,D-transpeptidase [Oscillatoria laete-virens NRMC-F 0139]